MLCFDKKVCPWLVTFIEASLDFWLQFLIQAERVGVLELCMTACWLLWSNCSRCLHDQTFGLPTSLVLLANRMMEEFKALEEVERFAQVYNGILSICFPPTIFSRSM